MITVRTAEELENTVQSWKRNFQSVAFVPTMGGLHDGHLSLVNIAKGKGDHTVVSIFINPTQFAPHEDFDSYPRDEAGDIEKLEKLGVDLVYIPSTGEVYPPGSAPLARAGKTGEGLEAHYRPHFFDGVVNAVSRLFDQVQPDIAVFGEKDYQQLCVIQEMVRDLGLEIEIVAGPVIRDAGGLALSSRNGYLNKDQLETARKLNKILKTAGEQMETRADQASYLIDEAKKQITEAGFEGIDYLELRAENTLAPLLQANQPGRLLACVKLNGVRLLDNVPVIPK